MSKLHISTSTLLLCIHPGVALEDLKTCIPKFAMVIPGLAGGLSGVPTTVSLSRRAHSDASMTYNSMEVKWHLRLTWSMSMDAWIGRG